MSSGIDKRGAVATLRDSELGWILGQAVRRLRERRGLSQEAVARRLERSRETVRRIESGKGTTMTTLDSVLGALDYTPADLLTEAAATPPYLRGQRAGWMAPVVHLATYRLNPPAGRLAG